MKMQLMVSTVCLATVSAFGGIKDAYKGRFHVGAALGKWVYEKVPNAESDIVAANFNSITAENRRHSRSQGRPREVSRPEGGDAHDVRR